MARRPQPMPNLPAAAAVYSPPPPPPTPEYYPPTTPTPTTPYCPPPPLGGGGGYEPSPVHAVDALHARLQPTPSGSGWYAPPYTPPSAGTLYPQDPGFRPNAAPRRAATLFSLAAAVACACFGLL
ncbi:hypothetical protein ZEAMMB73_Zm00001d008450 [Zea mays]|uniref:Uncharacterized protein n=1 Tax=Zea mays TaxID=4577 RepID=A0A1D6FD05_MAIZE|nr:hypothetical protein ZEAMMB73_Zm00001d008450 [Zea mays]